ncbi:MAG: flagellar brake protein, partial [Rhodocyclaceae bacterium]
MAEPSPPPPDASPAALDLSRGDALEKYTLRGARQILQLLQDLITHRGLITAHTGGGHSFMTAVLRVDEERARVV